MKKLFCTVLALLVLTVPAFAAETYTVQRGDTMWKIAAKVQVGTLEIIEANPQVQNPDLIYPGQRLTIPKEDQTTLSYEEEVVRLVNAERAKVGLSPLTMNWELSRNIAMGYATPAAVVNAWMNSSGHRANILSAKFTQIGVGYVANGNYCTQMFIG